LFYLPGEQYQVTQELVDQKGLPPHRNTSGIIKNYETNVFNKLLLLVLLGSKPGCDIKHDLNVFPGGIVT